MKVEAANFIFDKITEPTKVQQRALDLLGVSLSSNKNSGGVMQFSHTQNLLEYIVIGSGPAGLQMGYYLEQQQLSYLILEANEKPSSFFESFPRHRKLISINKVYTGYTNPEVNLRWDWNSLLSHNQGLLLKNYSERYFPYADDLVKYLADFATSFKLKIKYGVKVTKVSKRDNIFQVVDSEGNIYICRYLIIATGLFKPYTPPIPGIENAENYVDVSIQPEDFKNQQVLILGKGNSAFETADNLVETAAKIHVASPNPLKMAWQTHYVGHLRAVNNNILDTYHLKSQNAILDATILDIKRQNDKFIVTVKYSHACNEVEQLTYDRVIVCTGFKFDASIFDETCQPKLAINERFPQQTSEWESSNVKDMYFIGTLMQMRDYKKHMSGFIHGFRYNIHALSKILAHKYHQEKLPYQEIDISPENLTDYIIQRINISSALWQQPGFLCDAIALNKNEQSARYYQDLPVNYVQERMMDSADEYLLITLEYGAEKAVDPFNIERIARTDKERAELSQFLHPIIRHYRNSQLLQEHHIIEDLIGEWLEEEHIMPLLQFCKQQLNSFNPQLV
ncbi:MULTISPECIES: NAD(P)-binding domain-containing protein [unclassified Anabaena]|uniref:NAD(P)-binding domain-containing protein n=1 Tax=unclassified Anabaena TaxID=2619674 RepID=UPI0039C6B98E